MLEAGKKYKQSRSGIVYECVWANKIGAVLVDVAPNSAQYYVDQLTNSRYEEYKEPQKVEAWVNVFRDLDTNQLTFGHTYETEAIAKSYARFGPIFRTIDTIKIEYTEKT